MEYRVETKVEFPAYYIREEWNFFGHFHANSKAEAVKQARAENTHTRALADMGKVWFRAIPLD